MLRIRKMLNSTIITRSQRLLSGLNDLPVKHHKNERKFVIDVNSKKATLDYEELGDVLNLYETNVPEEYQGRGIGKILAKSAFDYAIENKYKMLLSCTYLQKYYYENYELYKNHVLDNSPE